MKDSPALAKAALMKKLSGFEPTRENFKEIKKKTTPEALAAAAAEADADAAISSDVEANVEEEEAIE